jgi:hypothetical protein
MKIHQVAAVVTVAPLFQQVSMKVEAKICDNNYVIRLKYYYLFENINCESV